MKLLKSVIFVIVLLSGIQSCLGPKKQSARQQFYQRHYTPPSMQRIPANSRYYSNPYEIYKGGSYIELGGNNSDGAEVVISGYYDVNIPGVYTVEYSSNYSYGTLISKRKIVVYDTIITLNGPSTYEMSTYHCYQTLLF